MLSTAGGTAASHAGVTLHILDAPFSGELASLDDKTLKTSSRDELPETVAGYPVLQSKTAVVAWTSDSCDLTFWSRRQDRLTERGKVSLDSASGKVRFQILKNNKHGMAVAVESPKKGVRHVVALSKDGILEIRQPPGQTAVVHSPLRYMLVPSLIGTDLLYDPEDLSAERSSYLPSLNMVVGLASGGDGMLVGVWPPGDHVARLQVGENSPRRIESFSLDTAGECFYLAFLDHPGIWHEERLRDEYLETDTPIAWRRPFDARWIGRFFIDSDGYHFPFYFLAQKHKLWGRYIRGWHYYPVWFDGDKTMVHFEKKFPPMGELLIYYLDTDEDDAELSSPAAVMRRSLGHDEAARLLDFEGTKEQVLLEHRNAVCAMTYKIESYFALEVEAPPWTVVKQYCDDVAKFIRLIRERVLQFDQFAADLQELLEIEKNRQPSLSAALEPCQELLMELREIVEADLPETPLEEIGAWTDSIKTLTTDDARKSLEITKILTQQCRSVAGAQDDLARDLSIVTIRLMEEAAKMGTRSPEHVRLAEQIITRCRSILRQPTWWEPCRKYLPKSNPGAP
jgi:hypothetical protein